MTYKEQVDYSRLPHHIAIIMDGNGRWANARGMERTMGHQEGAQIVHDIMTAATAMGIDYLTLYTFSTENWNRPEQEVSALMAILLQHLEEELFMKNNARFLTIGEITRLPQIVQDAIQHLKDVTSKNTGTCLVLALSYSSRWEMAKAVKTIAQKVASGEIVAEDINESTIDHYLETSFMPEPELMIRTGGEQRLSNFLLHQSAYTELYFTDIYWPDFNEEELCKAICDYQGRQRRFGKTEAQVEEQEKKEQTR